MIYINTIILIVAILMNWQLFVKMKLPVLVAGLAGFNLTVFAIYLPSFMLAVLGYLSVTAVASVLVGNILFSSWFVFRGGLVMPKAVNLWHVAFGVLAAVLFTYLLFFNFQHYNIGNLSYASLSGMLEIEGNPFPQHISYGANYLLPYIYQKLALVFLIHYVSAADPITYLLYFAPVLWALVQMGLLTGSYTCFQMLVGRPLPALFLSLIFVHYAIVGRFLSVVGESYGWVAGFGFVSLAIYLLKHNRNEPLLWLAVGMSLFITVNLHGVAAFVSLLFVVGYFLYSLRKVGRQLVLSNWRQIGVGVLLFLTLIGMGKVLIDHRLDPRQKGLFSLNHVEPKEGMVDYGLVYKNILSGSGDRPKVHAAPYYPWPTFFMNFGKKVVCGLTLFTEQPVIILPLLAMLFYLVRRQTLSPEIWVFCTIIVGIFCLAVYLNNKSAAAFPALIVTRRLDHHSQAVALLLSISIILLFWQCCPRLWNDKVLLVGIVALLCLILPKPKSVFYYHPKEYPARKIVALSKVIKKYSEPGYNVITNLRTSDVLQFATGKIVVSEGGGPYQQYGLMKKIVSSIDELRYFFQYPSLSYLQHHKIDLVIILKDTKIANKFVSVKFENLIPLIPDQPYLKSVYENGWMRAYKVVPSESKVEKVFQSWESLQIPLVSSWCFCFATWHNGRETSIGYGS